MSRRWRYRDVPERRGWSRDDVPFPIVDDAALLFGKPALAAFGHHDPVIDGLGPGGHGERQEDTNRREFLHHSAG